MKSAQATSRHASAVAPSAVVVLMAGGLRHSPLRHQLGIPSLCLPLQPGVTLLDRWLRAAEAIAQCRSVLIVVSTSNDAEQIQACVDRHSIAEPASAMEVKVVLEPSTWRGPAGLLYDVLHSSYCDVRNRGKTVVVAGEASCVPPDNLQEVLSHLDTSGPGVSLTSSTGEPIGLYAFTESALGTIPTFGFYDIKEQMLPALYACGTPVQAMCISASAVRVRDRNSYLTAVRALQTDESSCSAAARIAGTARVAGHCLIESGAIVGPQAIVHESVVLSGAVIGAGAVVSHSVIGPSRHIQPGTIVKRAVVGESGRDRKNATMRALSGMFGIGALLRGEQAS